MKLSIALSDGWTLRAIDPDPDTPAAQLPADIPAQVPGTVYTDLLTACLIEDPYLDLNEPTSAWIGHQTWSYVTHFDAPATGNRTDLVFDGLDTVATVILNGHELGRTFNQHRTYRFAADNLLDTGNELEVRFGSAWEYASALQSELGPLPNAYPTPFNFIRKMASNFGWDWGPQLVTAGLWREARLETWSLARLSEVRASAGLVEDDGLLDLNVSTDRTSDQPLTVTATVAGKSMSVPLTDGTASFSVRVPEVDVWWPRGMGGQPLYDLVVTLTSGDEELDSYTTRVGFRSVGLDTSDDTAGAKFEIVVNGVPIFIRGANWIPDDCFPSRVTRERYQKRIEQAAGANLNLLRVWGGGIYESDDFYELCDAAGMLVWQDFPFACAAYPEEEPIRSEVIAEVRDNLPRLMSHASLVLLNGCNENIWGWFDWDWQAPVGNRTWGAGYYLEILPALVAEISPAVPYWPGSPFSGSMDVHPNDDSRGNVHIWDVWNKRDYTGYADYSPRFVSEFGFQGPATWSTIARAIHDEPLSSNSPGMLLHQKADDGNGKLDRGMAPHLPAPHTFEDWHYLTQLNQSRAIVYAIERFRSMRGHCMGTIVWQLNDCWPVSSWAAIDGDGRRKPLWHGLRKANSDRLLSIQKNDRGHLELVAINDSREPWTGDVSVSRRRFDGSAVTTVTTRLDVPGLSRNSIPLLADLSMPDVPSREVVVGTASGATTAVQFFLEDLHLDFGDPGLTVEVGEWNSGVQTLRLAAGSLARSVCLFVDRIHPEAWVDRAAVDVIPGAPETFTIHTPVPIGREEITSPTVLRSVNDVTVKQVLAV